MKIGEIMYIGFITTFLITLVLSLLFVAVILFIYHTKIALIILAVVMIIFIVGYIQYCRGYRIL